HRVLQDVLGVAGGAHAQNLDGCSLVGHLFGNFADDLLRVLNRIALRELVGLAQDVAVPVHQHRFGGGGAAIYADEAFYYLPRLERSGHKFLLGVLLFEGFQFVGCLGQGLGAALLGFLDSATFGDIPLQLFVAQVHAHAGIFLFAELNRANAGKILGVIRRAHQVFGIYAFRERVVALFPDFGNIV